MRRQMEKIKERSSKAILFPLIFRSKPSPCVCMHGVPCLEEGDVYQKLTGGWIMTCMSGPAPAIGPALSTLARSAHRPCSSVFSLLPYARPWYVTLLRDVCTSPYGRGHLGWRRNSLSFKISIVKHLLLSFLTFCPILSGMNSLVSG